LQPKKSRLGLYEAFPKILQAVDERVPIEYQVQLSNIQRLIRDRADIQRQARAALFNLRLRSKIFKPEDSSELANKKLLLDIYCRKHVVVLLGRFCREKQTEKAEAIRKYLRSYPHVQKCTPRRHKRIRGWDDSYPDVKRYRGLASFKSLQDCEDRLKNPPFTRENVNSPDFRQVSFTPYLNPNP
jgi:hypothetical protein